MTPFQAYQTYLALKQHFSQPSYDYFKYNGKVNVRADSFDTRRDKYQFYKLSKHKDPVPYMVANFIRSKVSWVGDLLSDQGESNYVEWLKQQQSLTYNFTQEIEKLCTNFNDNFIVKNGQHPILLKLYRQGEVSIETVVILNDIVGFFPHWNKCIDDNVLWPEIHNKLVKYKPFFQYDIFKCRKILKDRFAEE
jgi:hypothetical protein